MARLDEKDSVSSPVDQRSPAGWFHYGGLAYAVTVLIVGTSMPTPLYVLYERAFGMSPLEVTLLVAVYSGAVLVALLICGPLSDAFGYRLVLTCGLVVAVGGAALLAAASGALWLVAGRAVQGLAVGAATGALTAGLVLTEPRGRPGRASLLASAATTAGCGIGPVAAGALAQFAGRPRVLCYLVEIGLLIPAIGVVATLPRTLGVTGRRWSPRRPRIPASIRRSFVIPAAVSCIAWSIAYVVLTLVPSYAAASLGRSNLLVDGGASGSLLLFAAAAQLVFRSWQARRAQAVGLLLLVAGVLGLIAAGMLGSAAVLFVTIAIAGAGLGIGFMGSLRQLNALAPAALRAETVSMFYVVTYVGGGLSTVGVGLLATHVTLTASVQVFAAVFAALALMTLGALLLGRGPAAGEVAAVAVADGT
jgi:predicted MFS family arabinose efflux permease